MKGLENGFGGKRGQWPARSVYTFPVGEHLPVVNYSAE